MELESLKNKWQSVGNTAADVSPEHYRGIVNRLTADRSRSISEKIAMRMKLLAIICFLLPVNCLQLEDMHVFSTLTLIFTSIYGIACGARLLWFSWKVRNTNYLEMPVRQAFETAASLAFRRRRMRLWSEIASIPVLLLMFRDIVYVSGDIYILYAGLTGGVVGLIIGLRINYVFNRRFRELKALFDEECSTDKNITA